MAAGGGFEGQRRGMQVGNRDLLWEWEHGFRAGVGACEGVVLGG